MAGNAPSAPTAIVPVEPSMPTGRWDLDLDKQNKDCANCCWSFFLNAIGCNCFVLGDIADNLGHDWGLHCCCFATSAPVLHAYLLRMEMMRIRAIPLQPCCGCKGECGEFCRICWCYPCVMCQMRHESNIIKAARLQEVTAQAIIRE